MGFFYLGELHRRIGLGIDFLGMFKLKVNLTYLGREGNIFR